jgi:hypothetical protein
MSQTIKIELELNMKGLAQLFCEIMWNTLLGKASFIY